LTVTGGGFKQSGKCVADDTIITIKNKETGKIKKIEIGEFFEQMS
jgi:hypothetical protein